MDSIPNNMVVQVNDDGIIKHLTWAQFGKSSAMLLGPKEVIDFINLSPLSIDTLSNLQSYK